MTMQPGLDTLQGILLYRARLTEIIADQATGTPEDRVPVALMPSTMARMLDCLLDLIPQSHKRLPSQGLMTTSGRQARRPKPQMPQTDTERHPQPSVSTSVPKEPSDTSTRLSPRKKRKRRH